jgi:hypothetical protein
VTDETKRKESVMKKQAKEKGKVKRVVHRNTKKYGARHSPEERKELLAKYRALRKKNVTALEAAKQVGVKYITLRSWAVSKGQLTRSIKKPKPTRRGKAKRPASGLKSLFCKKVRVTFKNGTVVEFQTLDDFFKAVKFKV